MSSLTRIVAIVDNVHNVTSAIKGVSFLGPATRIETRRRPFRRSADPNGVYRLDGGKHSMYFFVPVRRLTSLSTCMPPGRHRLSGWSDDVACREGVPDPRHGEW